MASPQDEAMVHHWISNGDAQLPLTTVILSCDQLAATNSRTLCRLSRDPMNDRMRVMQRQPRRISITLSYQVHEGLLTRSEEEGRSLSNLCAFLLEEALRDSSRLMFDGKTMPGKPPLPMGDGQLPTRREFQGESWRPHH